MTIYEAERRIEFDKEFALKELRKGPRDAMQIIGASFRERDTGLTVHSRVADLRRDGYEITCAIEGKTRKGRARYVYRLQAAGRVEPPAVGHVAQSAEMAAPVPDVNPGQLRLVG